MWFEVPKKGAHHSGEALSFFDVAVSLYEKGGRFTFLKSSTFSIF